MPIVAGDFCRRRSYDPCCIKRYTGFICKKFIRGSSGESAVDGDRNFSMIKIPVSFSARSPAGVLHRYEQIFAGKKSDDNLGSQCYNGTTQTKKNCVERYGKRFMKKKIGAGLVVILLAFLYYYVTLPAVNIHESGFWVFLGALVVLILIIYGIKKRITSVQQLRSDKILKGGLILLLAVVIVYGAGALLSSRWSMQRNIRL